MAARSVQISLDAELLAEVDRQAKARDEGRSAFIRRALRQFMRDERRRAIDESYARAYAEKADELFEEVKDLIEGQVWPDD